MRPGRRGKRRDSLWLLSNRFADQKCFSQGGDLTGPRADEADAATAGFTARTGEGPEVIDRQFPFATRYAKRVGGFFEPNGVLRLRLGLSRALPLPDQLCGPERGGARGTGLSPPGQMCPGSGGQPKGGKYGRGGRFDR
jgi:hypothetical protein